MSEVRRPETEVKTSKKSKVGLRSIKSYLFKKPLLPTPEFGLPSLKTKVSIKITVEPN